MYVYAHVRVYERVRMFSMYTYAHVCIYEYVYVFMSMSIPCIFEYAYVYLWVCIRMHMCVFMSYEPKSRACACFVFCLIVVQSFFLENKKQKIEPLAELPPLVLAPPVV
jgi:hypothetical protein